MFSCARSRSKVQSLANLYVPTVEEPAMLSERGWVGLAVLALKDFGDESLQGNTQAWGGPRSSFMVLLFR